MPVKRPQYQIGNFYHFFNRGARCLSIFRENDSYQFVIRKLRDTSRLLSLTVIAYCLLPNHYHLLIRQSGNYPAGLLPQRIFNSYSKAYNKRYAHSGTLFEGNYKVKLIEQEAHLLHLCRYIHANPVAHGLVSDILGWPYSNYLEWLGEREGSLVDRDFIHEQFRSSRDYQFFVSDYIEERSLPKDLENYLHKWED